MNKTTCLKLNCPCHSGGECESAERIMKEQVYGSKEWPSFWKTIVESKEGKAWYKEQMARFSRMCKDKDCKTDEEVFDVDESFECGYMSPRHWKAFIKFVKTMK